MRNFFIRFVAAFFVLGSAFPAWSDVYIGGLSNSTGSPPQVGSDTFFSPTRYIQLNPSNRPSIHGRDSSDTTCIDIGYNVTAQFRCNDQVIPFSGSYYFVWDGDGLCRKIFYWEKGLEIDLGQPGTFSVEVTADNSLGLGNVSLSQWEFWTVGDPVSEYEILSVTADKDFYVCDQDTMVIDFIVRNNYGEYSDLDVDLELVPNVGPTVPLGIQNVSVSPGQQVDLRYRWPVPQLPGVTIYDALISVNSTAAKPLIMWHFEEIGGQAELSYDLPEGVRTEILECDVDYSCLVLHSPLVHLVNTEAEMDRIRDEYCRSESFRAEERETIAGAGHFFGSLVIGGLGLQSAIGTFLFYNLEARKIPVWGTIRDVVALNACIIQEAIWHPIDVKSTSSTVSTIADSLQTYLVGYEPMYCDIMIVEGAGDITIKTPDQAIARVDSTEIDTAIVIKSNDVGIQTAAMTPGAGAFWGTPVNASNEGAFTYVSASEDTIDIALLHLDNSGLMTALHYAPIQVKLGSQFKIDVSVNMTAPVLLFDDNGDGTYEKTYYPGGGISGVDDGVVFPVAGALSLANAPNPFNPKTTISFEIPTEQAVSLRVFDVAGRLVKTLIEDEVYGQGRHQAIWRGRDDNGRRLSSGTYFYRLEAGEFSETKRMVLLK